jgi:hypothetical protein
MLLKSYSFTFYYLQKDFEKNFQKEFAKTKHVVQAWSKILKLEESHPCISSRNSYWFHSKQPLHLHYANQFNYALLYLLWFVLASVTKKGEIEREIGLHLFLIDFGG